MSLWSSLLPAAMVGTERQPPVVPSLSGPLHELLGKAAAEAATPASSLLRMAAVLATCAQAGAKGAPQSAELPLPAGDEPLPAPAEPLFLSSLGRALQLPTQRLHHLALNKLIAEKQRLPAHLLPTALELGRRSLALRAALLPVLGERGLWLAALNPAWQYAAGVSAAADDDACWEEGSLAQRCGFLARERHAAPASARERLERGIAPLPAKERAELLSQLVIGLSAADEPFLEGMLQDRSREVRTTAQELLLRLPESRFVCAAQKRLEPFLRKERVLLRQKWILEAPAAAAEEWKEAGLELIRPPKDPLGERAWLLYQLARQVPLSWWRRQTGMDPPELLAFVAGSDWGDAVLRAWRELLPLEPDAAWCEALLDNWPRQYPENEFAGFLARLPLPKRERYWLRQLRSAKSAPQPLGNVLQQITQACPDGELVSADFSLVLVDAVAGAAKSNLFASDYQLRPLLPEICCLVSNDSLKRLTPFPRQPEETKSLAELLGSVEQIIDIRRKLAI